MEKRNHSKQPAQLPNWCSLGVSLRVVLTVEVALAAAVIARVPDAATLRDEFIGRSSWAQPALLLTLLTLCASSRLLRVRPYLEGAAWTLAIAVAVPLGVAAQMRAWLPALVQLPLPAIAAFAASLALGLLAWFKLRDRALSPALAEARLQALQARIRPHFLFNSLNAVLSLIRSDPARAERALEDLSELFRALMSEVRQLVALDDEIRLTRAYLELEQLRLGDRLDVRWHIDKMPRDARVPPLLIQPLVENAVYHGVEPAAHGGEISINVYRSQDRVHLVIRNPLADEAGARRGNGIALDNIRERLLLHFDLDATLKSERLGAVYQVHISFPYTRGEPAPHPDR